MFYQLKILKTAIPYGLDRPFPVDVQLLSEPAALSNWQLEIAFGSEVKLVTYAYLAFTIITYGSVTAV